MIFHLKKRYKNLTLDSSLPFRFANIKVNSKLDLKKNKSIQKDLNINIALQLDNGQRLTQSFPSSTTLWQILKAFEPSATG